MQKRKWETSFCFVCDFWWLILLLMFLLLVAALTSSIWLPLIGIAPENPPVLPTDVPVSGEPTELPDNWLTYTDAELGYSIEYPASWKVNEPTIRQQNEYIESVVLAQQGGITSQTRGPDESARVLVRSYPKRDMGLETWIITHWNWLDGQVVKERFLGYQAARANSIPADSIFTNNLLWIERDQDILCFWAQTDMSMTESGKIVLTMFDGIKFLK